MRQRQARNFQMGQWVIDLEQQHATAVKDRAHDHEQGHDDEQAKEVDSCIFEPAFCLELVDLICEYVPSVGSAIVV